MNAAAPFTRQSELAHECAELAKRMPGTVGNWKLVLEGLMQSINDETWGDTSLVMQCLEEAQAALAEVRAHDEAEIAEFVQDRMGMDRRAA